VLEKGEFQPVRRLFRRAFDWKAEGVYTAENICLCGETQKFLKKENKFYAENRRENEGKPEDKVDKALNFVKIMLRAKAYAFPVLRFNTKQSLQR